MAKLHIIGRLCNTIEYSCESYASLVNSNHMERKHCHSHTDTTLYPLWIWVHAMPMPRRSLPYNLHNPSHITLSLLKNELKVEQLKNQLQLQAQLTHPARSHVAFQYA